VLHSSGSGVVVKTSTSVPPALRFGVFEFDPRAKELRKKGIEKSALDWHWGHHADELDGSY